MNSPHHLSITSADHLGSHVPILVSSADPRDDGFFYGAPFLPTSRGKLWKCTSKEQYLDFRKGFEESEANCNTCKYLQRLEHAKCPSGFLEGLCGKTRQLLRFHPEDPAGHPCWESRRS